MQGHSEIYGTGLKSLGSASGTDKTHDTQKNGPETQNYTRGRWRRSDMCIRRGTLNLEGSRSSITYF